MSWPGPGAHSAVKLWNKDWVYVSDEVYGTAPATGHGCPWGWTRFIDIADETRPVVVSEFRLPENQPLVVRHVQPAADVLLGPQPDADAEHRVQHVALGRLPGDGHHRPDATSTQLAEFKPEPLPSVGVEDPRLSSDGILPGRTDNKVVMWSYPVIQDGLIYTVDLRNGLYILKYNGPYQQEVDDIKFLEGNSNQGDALCFEPVPGAVPADCSPHRHPGRRGRHGAGHAVADARARRRASARSRPAWPRTTRRPRRPT